MGEGAFTQRLLASSGSAGLSTAGSRGHTGTGTHTSSSDMVGGLFLWGGGGAESGIGEWPGRAGGGEPWVLRAVV